MTAATADPAITAGSLSGSAPRRGEARRPGRGPDIARTAGPALLISAGYVDPGNWGTDVAAGAQFGYRLIWVLLAATLAALFLQQLAARVGIASGRDLASLIETRLTPRTRRLIIPPVLAALAVAEVVEVLGVVIGVQLLTGWGWCAVPMAGVLVVAVVIAPAGFGRRAVYGCLALVGAVYVGTLLLGGGGPDVARGLAPSALPPGGLPVAVGMIGAVVMPHNILLHSALARDLRTQAREPGDARRLMRGSFATMAVTLLLALAVNCSITSLAAQSAAGSSGGMSGAVEGLQAAIGPAASTLFAVTLIAAGLASSVTGGMISSDAIKQLLPGLRLGNAARRTACLVPALAVAGLGLPEVTVLVWSQVALTLALPLILVPLLWFASQEDVMRGWALRWPARMAGAAITAALAIAGAASLIAG